MYTCNVSQSCIRIHARILLTKWYFPKVWYCLKCNSKPSLVSVHEFYIHTYKHAYIHDSRLPSGTASRTLSGLFTCKLVSATSLPCSSATRLYSTSTIPLRYPTRCPVCIKKPNQSHTDTRMLLLNVVACVCTWQMKIHGKMKRSVNMHMWVFVHALFQRYVRSSKGMCIHMHKCDVQHQKWVFLYL